MCSSPPVGPRSPWPSYSPRRWRSLWKASTESSRAISGAIASAMSLWTSLSLYLRAILHVVPTCIRQRKSQARILPRKL